MSYVQNNLSKDEIVVCEGKLHWIVFMPGVVLLFSGIAIVVHAKDFSGWGSLVLLFAVFRLAASIVEIASTELAITTKRVIVKTGLIGRETIELNHTKVESFHVDQSILGRILNYGTLTVNGTGGGETRIASIVDPLAFRRCASNEIERVQAL